MTVRKKVRVGRVSDLNCFQLKYVICANFTDTHNHVNILLGPLLRWREGLVPGEDLKLKLY